MAKQKKQLWQNADPRMEQIREEHALFGAQLWRRAKRKGGEELDPAATLAEEAERVRRLQADRYDRWLRKETETVVKFFKPGWWLKPIKWFKAHDMRKRRDLCTYMVTLPHMAKSSNKRSEPVMSGLLDYGFFRRPFESLLRLSKRVFRWFKKLSYREQVRHEVRENMKKLAEKSAKEAAIKKVKALIDLDNKAESQSLWAQGNEDHQKYKAKIAREKDEMRGTLKRWCREGMPLDEKCHKDFMAGVDRELVNRKEEISQFKGQIAKQDELRERERAEREARIQRGQEEYEKQQAKAQAEHEERMAQIIKEGEAGMAEIMREYEERRELEVKEKAEYEERQAKIQKEQEKRIAQIRLENREAEESRQAEQVASRYKDLERESREISIRNGWLRRGAESDQQRRLRELQPTIVKLKTMMAMVWVCQVTGTSTLDKIAAVIAEHDHIAARNGLTREGFDNYRYSILNDRRIAAGPDLADSFPRQTTDPHIIDERSCGAGLVR